MMSLMVPKEEAERKWVERNSARECLSFEP